MWYYYVCDTCISENTTCDECTSYSEVTIMSYGDIDKLNTRLKQDNKTVEPV